MFLSLCYISFMILFLVGVFCFSLSVYFLMNDLVIIIEYILFSMNSAVVNLFVLMDFMSLLFASLVMLISSMVIYYSKSYMHLDFYMNRFIWLVLLFILSMMMLIFMPNMISILLGWDGLGLVSFCLVIYYQNNKSYNSGMLVVLSNRIGDVFILMAICWMFNFGGWSFFYYLYYFKMNNLFQFVGVFVMLAAITKSAQIPFSSWLPAAMAAPTPVSALVHSSTLVTAGVYLLIRFSEMMVGMLVFKVLLVLGGITMFMSGMAANYEYDVKKIIALSTLSQLGLMVSILSLGGVMMSYFHLLAHAMFKALLFMCAGMMIHNMLGFQDIRMMGNLIKFMPLTGGCFMISNLALSGFPFLAGFYSKDLILDSVSMMNINFIVWFLFFVSTGLTISYTTRMLYYVMFKLDFVIFYFSFEDSDKIMFNSMLMLGILSMMGGSMLSWLILTQVYMIYMVMWLKLMTLTIMFIGLMMGGLFIYLSNNLFKLSFINYFMHMNFSMWFLVIFSTWGVNKYFVNLMKLLSEVVDKGWNEYILNFKSVSYLQNWSVNNSSVMIFNYKIYLILMVCWSLFLYMMFIMIL
uniref:NADH-ubiquinone oxidoreductase chain 5 n=1 Tax=Hydroptila sp. XG-2021 TaxID=2996735 RepID=A0A9E8LNX8_9NEOP|nr:NADH dehydrogenase subunit 5 [Hydroptila sp. XG-2021]